MSISNLVESKVYDLKTDNSYQDYIYERWERELEGVDPNLIKVEGLGDNWRLFCPANDKIKTESFFNTPRPVKSKYVGIKDGNGVLYAADGKLEEFVVKKENGEYKGYIRHIPIEDCYVRGIRKPEGSDSYILDVECKNQNSFSSNVIQDSNRQMLMTEDYKYFQFPFSRIKYKGDGIFSTETDVRAKDGVENSTVLHLITSDGFISDKMKLSTVCGLPYREAGSTFDTVDDMHDLIEFVKEKYEYLVKSKEDKIERDILALQYKQLEKLKKARNERKAQKLEKDIAHKNFVLSTFNIDFTGNSEIPEFPKKGFKKLKLEGAELSLAIEVGKDLDSFNIFLHDIFELDFSKGKKYHIGELFGNGVSKDEINNMNLRNSSENGALKSFNIIIEREKISVSVFGYIDSKGFVKDKCQILVLGKDVRKFRMGGEHSQTIFNSDIASISILAMEDLKNVINSNLLFPKYDREKSSIKTLGYNAFIK